MWDLLKRDVRRHYAALDAQTQNWIDCYETSGRRIHCGRGCSSCCNLAVNTTYPEALFALECMSTDHHIRLNDHVSRLIDNTRKASDFKDFLRRHRTNVGFCPFLGKSGSCEIYSSRPLSCRSLISTKNPSWCSVDFGDLDPLEKRLYMESLDRGVVAFPIHYVKAVQDSARDHEEEIFDSMEESLGFSLSGTLSALIYLETQHNISKSIMKGLESVIDTLTKLDLNNPFFVQLFKKETSALKQIQE